MLWAAPNSGAFGSSTAEVPVEAVGSPTMPSRVPTVASPTSVFAPPPPRSEPVERVAPRKPPPTVKALLIRWSTPRDMSLPESPLRIAAISSGLRLKPRSAAAGSD